MHGHDHDLGAAPHRSHIPPHLIGVEHGDARVDIEVIAVRLIEGVTKIAEAPAVAFQNRAGMRRFGVLTRTSDGDPILLQPGEREGDAFVITVAGVIVGRRHDVDARMFQSLDHMRLGAKDQFRSSVGLLVPKRRLEVDEGNVRLAENLSHVA